MMPTGDTQYAVAYVGIHSPDLIAVIAACIFRARGCARGDLYAMEWVSRGRRRRCDRRVVALGTRHGAESAVSHPAARHTRRESDRRLADGLRDGGVDAARRFAA